LWVFILSKNFSWRVKELIPERSLITHQNKDFYYFINTGPPKKDKPTNSKESVPTAIFSLKKVVATSPCKFKTSLAK
jgi:hypothetical protein